MPKGWDIENFLKNPVVLWAHNYSELPIAIAEKVEKIQEGLKIALRFASEKANPKAQQVRLLVEEGIQKAVSVGFIPHERDESDEKIITKAELLELSFVPVPANPNALALAKAKGIDSDMFEKEEKLAHGRVEQAIQQVESAPDFEGKDNVLSLLNQVLELLPSLEEEGKQRETTEVQTVILSKERFETLEEAKNWITEHDFTDEKVDETENSWRFRQFPPTKCQEGTFRTIDITDGVNAVICRPTKGGKSYIEISNLSESKKSEPTKKKEPSRKAEARSTKDAGIIVELPLEKYKEVQELRKRALREYREKELILSITKRVRILKENGHKS